MANEEQEINRQSEAPTQATETLAVNTPEDTPTQPQDSVEGTEAAPESTEVSATASADEAPATAASTTETQPERVGSENTEAIQTPADSAANPADEAAPEPIAETTTEEQPVADATAPADEPAVADEITAQYADVQEHDETEEEAQAQPAADYSQFSRQDFISLLETQLATVSAASVTPGDFKKADQLLKEVKPHFDQMKRAEREAALQAYVAESGSEEGFEYKNDETVQRFDDLYKQIKSLKNTYFQNLDKAKDGNFAAKTELLTRLRELVETDENNAGDPKASWNEFKKSTLR